MHTAPELAVGRTGSSSTKGGVRNRQQLLTVQLRQQQPHPYQLAYSSST
jgi:hypothetical protein